MTPQWTTPEDVVARVRRRWDDGSLLRAHAEGEPMPRIEVAVHGPSASQVGEDLGATREWVRRLDAGRRNDARYALEWTSIGGRRIGRNQVPSRAIVSRFEQAWALLGVGSQVRAFDQVLELTGSRPQVRAWVLGHPFQAFQVLPELPALLAAHDWLDRHRGSRRYLREIDAVGVDTKFAERHRKILAATLGVPAAPARFLAALGLRAKPEFTRLRVAASLGLPRGLAELAVPAEALAEVSIRPHQALVIENEITYLSVPVPQDGVVVWGKGFDVDRAGRIPWLVGADVVYWGDLDTHGFAILNRLRAWLPTCRSLLMDRATLLAFRDRWGTEDSPTRSRLSRLSPDEEDLYADLVTDRWADRVRLEQERIDWAWVRARLDGALTFGQP